MNTNTKNLIALAVTEPRKADGTIVIEKNRSCGSVFHNKFIHRGHKSKYRSDDSNFLADAFRAEVDAIKAEHEAGTIGTKWLPL